MGLEQVLISHFIKASRSSWHGERKKDGSRRIVDSSRWNCKMFEKRLSESRRRFRSIFFVRAKSGARNELSYFFFISFFLSFFLFVNYTLSETNVSPEWFFRSFFIKNRDYNHRINESRISRLYSKTWAADSQDTHLPWSENSWETENSLHLSESFKRVLDLFVA